MGMSICCLKSLTRPPLKPTSSSPSLPTRTDITPRKHDGRSSWRAHHMVGLACSMIINIEMGDHLSQAIHSGAYLMANKLTNESQMTLSNKNKDNRIQVAKWSEKRMCPPWHLNSLETIVPEKLPRPSPHRKWEWISTSSQLAPSLNSSAESRSNSCFSL